MDYAGLANLVILDALRDAIRRLVADAGLGEGDPIHGDVMTDEGQDGRTLLLTLDGVVRGGDPHFPPQDVRCLATGRPCVIVVRGTDVMLPFDIGAVVTDGHTVEFKRCELVAG